jgi:mannose-6-phosphate isomerase-like protein (cupin superfamily)
VGDAQGHRAAIGRGQRDLLPNTTLVIPAQATRQAANTGEADLEVLVIRSLVRPPEKSLMEIMGKM